MTAQTQNIAILFADVSDSTRLYESLGDVLGRHKVSRCLNTVTEVVNLHQGKVVKTIGDEVMCTFDSADDAVSAACDIHESVERMVLEETATGTIAMAVRIGLHCGAAIVEGNDVFGDAVNTASRMASLAKARQILTTESTVQMLGPPLRSAARCIDRTLVKGKKDTIDIYEILWQPEDATLMASGIMLGKPPPGVMQLRYHDNHVNLNYDDDSLVLGRSHSCDLVVDEPLASRQHLRIECRHGKFYAVDQSTNGTYIQLDNGEEIFLRREQAPLRGSGQISLGRSFRHDPKETIQFSLQAAE
jgi:class 3 adenylate cyclase